MIAQALAARATARIVANEHRTQARGYTVADMENAAEMFIDMNDHHGYPISGDMLKVQGVK